jgi:signal transduction histidine kinase
MMAVNPLGPKSARVRTVGLQSRSAKGRGAEQGKFRHCWCEELLLIFVCGLMLLGSVHGAELPDTEPGAVDFPDIKTLLKSPPTPEASALVKVRGIVTYQHEGRSVFIQDETGGLYAGTQTVQPLHPGDEVEVVGWVIRTGFSPVLARCVIRKLGSVRMPKVASVSVEDALAGKHDMCLIRVSGQFVGWRERANSVFLMLVTDRVPFEAEFVKSRPGDPFPRLRLGSTVEVTGPCTVQIDSAGKINGMQLFLRSPFDLKVLSAAPWWTPERIRKAIVLFGALGLFAAIYIAALRYQVGTKTAQITNINQELERKVKQRTMELEATNKELEAFSYSVSHDLKGPVRAIQGFAQMLQEDHGKQLCSEGVNLVQRIEQNALNMFDLITGLLSFSRLSESSILAEKLDMTSLTQTAFDDLAHECAGRKIDFKLCNLPPGRGDKAMIKQVLINLISNAIKYTRGREPAMIEVTGIAGEREQTYIFRDNGIGFDMRRADQLFGLFKRLHRDAAYEGTGVGLAVAHRTVARHSGRIWAQAETGKGATFYFTLPTPEE